MYVLQIQIAAFSFHNTNQALLARHVLGDVVLFKEFDDNFLQLANSGSVAKALVKVRMALQKVCDGHTRFLGRTFGRFARCKESLRTWSSTLVRQTEETWGKRARVAPSAA